jgi:hypothetical protein
VTVVGCEQPGALTRARQEYFVYGVAVESDFSLPLPRSGGAALTRIQLRSAAPSFFSTAIEGVPLEPVSGSWYELARLANGSTYVRWKPVGEFIVSADGGSVFCRGFNVSTQESFQVYLLGHALSYALVKRGFEPLHATVVVVEGQGVAFLGRSGFGKSSLAASFLGSGHSILTDDLLLFQIDAAGILAYPGPPRIKLYPEAARRFLPNTAQGVPMNPETEKLILPLEHVRTCRKAIPLRAIYSLVAPENVQDGSSIELQRLPPRQVFLELVRGAFNVRVRDAGRLERQLHETARLVNLVPVKRLAFPRVWTRLPEVHEAIMSDLRNV